MCIICVELSMNKLTSKEARRALGEFLHVLDKKHVDEVYQAIWDKEDEEYFNWYNQEKYGDTD
jgi:hypothetical protein